MSTLAPHRLTFVCPRCRAGVELYAAGYRCRACAENYPVVAGIPDFRIAPDPWIGLEEDRRKALRLEEITRGLTFEESVRAYWKITPETPPWLAERFVSHVLGAEARSRQWLAALAAEAGPLPVGPWLDLGCGTADLAAAARPQAVVGVDIALRWLIIARKRPGVGDAQRLVCCGAEHLPFPDGAFARVLSLGLLEHCPDAGTVLREGRRVLRPEGEVAVRTCNRFSLLPEPHVGVWGVGFVPRRFADRFVRWRNGQRYLHHYPLSPRELARAFRAAGLARVRVAPATLLPVERARLGRAGVRAARGYDLARSAPALRDGLSWITPLLDARGTAPSPGDAASRQTPHPRGI